MAASINDLVLLCCDCGVFLQFPLYRRSLVKHHGDQNPNITTGLNSDSAGVSEGQYPFRRRSRGFKLLRPLITGVTRTVAGCWHRPHSTCTLDTAYIRIPETDFQPPIEFDSGTINDTGPNKQDHAAPGALPRRLDSRTVLLTP